MRYIQIALSLFFISIGISIFSLDFQSIMDQYNHLHQIVPINQDNNSNQDLLSNLLNALGGIFNAVAYAFATFTIAIQIVAQIAINSFLLGSIITNTFMLPPIVGIIADIIIFIVYLLAGYEAFQSLK